MLQTPRSETCVPSNSNQKFELHADGTIHIWSGFGQGYCVAVSVNPPRPPPPPPFGGVMLSPCDRVPWSSYSYCNHSLGIEVTNTLFISIYEKR